MNVKLFDSRNKKLNISVRPYKDGFRASITLKYKDGTSERIQKYSTESPEVAKEKVYTAASQKYYENLHKNEDEIVFSNVTNSELLKLEKEIPTKVIAESRNFLLFTNVSKSWLEMILQRTDKSKSRRSINLNTFEYYRSIVHTYLDNDFGKYKITELTFDIVQQVFDEKVALRYKTLKGNRSTLAQIFDFAKQKGFIEDNFVRNIQLREDRKAKIDFYTEEMCDRFRECCRMDGRNLAILYCTNLGLGLRPEERLWIKMESNSLFF